ncbi:Holliday junction resolvase [Candidatus Woesearchaeota archaeon]|nr:Holliday junction resolvase [Candidatus Woesearchaeota archaeon]
MANKHKGSNAERELLHLFWSKGWACSRVAGSGSSHYPSPDLIVGTPSRKLAIECKTTKASRKYFPLDEIDQLRKFCVMFGAEPWIGLRFSRTEWHFVALDDLDKTHTAYCISLEQAKQKGILLEELLELLALPALPSS